MKYDTRHAKNRLSALVTCAAVVLPVHGADPHNAQLALEEIIVTAQKRAQSLSDVGISISVVNEAQIRDARIGKVTDIVQFTANASIKENFPGLMPVITIRGVGLNDFNASNNPAAGVYVDEVSLSSLALMSSEFIDLASVEVLKGPQGTLYGRNSTAGALNFNTAKPNLEAYELRVQGGAGNYGAAELETMLNAPVGEDLAIRVVAKHTDQSEGYWENRALDRDVGRRNEWVARTQALWEPAEGNSGVLFKLEGHRGRSELGSPEFFGALPSPSSNNCPGSAGCANFFGYTDSDNDPFKGDWSTDPSYEQNQVLASIRVDTDLGFADLTSVTGYIDFDRHYATDVDASPLALVEFINSDEVQQFSEELRLSSSNDLYDWQAGLFYAVDEVYTKYEGQLGLFNTTTLSLADQKATSTAAFVNVDWALNETLTLITGIRYTKEKKSIDASSQDLVSIAPGSALSGLPFGAPAIVLASVNDKIADDSLSWKLGINAKLNDTTLLYGSATQSTKSGGFFTGVASTSSQLQPYDKETLLSYEFGLKSQAPSLGIRYELSTFYYEYDDVQTFIRDVSGDLPIQRLSNVEGATIYGLDASIHIRPPIIDGLSVGASLGILRTELSSFQSSAGLTPKGNVLPDAPETSAQLSASYDFDLVDNISATLAFDSQYQSSTFRDAVNDPLLESDSYWLINGRLSIYFGDDLELSAWGKNLIDKHYATQGLNQLVLGNGYRVYGPPRTFGFSATKTFR